MMKLGYHISHEQFSPADLLRYVKKAEEAGFQFALSSDHFHPWNNDQGHSGFAWAWLGAAMAQTDLNFGVVNCPAYRYHPAIIAQAAATLDNMFPDRFWMAIGSGQALNEAINGEHWPAREERNNRLKEAADIMETLWRGDSVTRHGVIKVEEAKLYTLPQRKIPLIGAAITPDTAAWLATWADGMITISQPVQQLQKVVDAWKNNGGENKPMVLKVQVSYDKSDEEAVKGAHEQWKTNVFGSDMLAELRTPLQFEQAAMHVKPEELHGHVNMSSDPGRHIDWLNQYMEMGFYELSIHNVNKKQEQFIDAFGEKIIPELMVTH
ncbi:TIGR03885 family FMN-dependent LLM class oxidoreductase [Cytophagaceae bacterium ABcell3]|nr:TIGR03885 family FMN-dependent LLM class oxidoreductase [Cytophagaceae bacterium ABcell3]